MSNATGNRALSRRYAKALFELAQKNNAVSAVEQTFSALLPLCKETAVETLLTNPLIRKSAQQKAVDALAQKLSFPPLVVQFLRTLVENRRLGLLPATIAQFSELARAARGEALVTVTTAKPLTDASRKELEQKLKQKLGPVVLSEEVDQSLLAGVVIHHGSRRLDASLKGRLQQLKHALA